MWYVLITAVVLILGITLTLLTANEIKTYGADRDDIMTLRLSLALILLCWAWPVLVAAGVVFFLWKLVKTIGYAISVAVKGKRW